MASLHIVHNMIEKLGTDDVTFTLLVSVLTKIILTSACIPCVTKQEVKLQLVFKALDKYWMLVDSTS